MIVEAEIGGQAGLANGQRVVSKKVYLLILDAAPQSLDEDVVQASAFAVHRDPDAARFQDRRELRRSELAALIRVENLRATMAPQGFLKSLDAESDVHGV